MASTLIYDKKKKREKAKARELEQVRERALKFYKGHGLSDVVGLNVSPQTELNALEAYVEDLHHLREQLEQKWGFIPEFKRSAWWVGSEINNALEHIVKLEIQLTSEGRQP